MNTCCDICGCECADYLIDPYMQDMHDTEVWRWLCADCYRDLLYDI